MHGEFSDLSHTARGGIGKLSNVMKAADAAGRQFVVREETKTFYLWPSRF
jgi:hypothetical protein